MKNLIRQYNQTSEQTRSFGLQWYSEANKWAQFLADKYGLSLEQVCGICSALSPGCAWGRNKLETQWLIESNLEGYDLEPFNFTTYGQNVVKAQRIYNGDNPETAFSLKTGAKTYNFYHNILNPKDDQYVTIDRHAWLAATGEQYKGISPKQYQTVAAHYVKSATKLKLLPNQLQAILWLNIRL